MEPRLNTQRCASVVLAMALCPCVCLSQTGIKMSKYIITQTTPHGSPWTLVLWCQMSLWNSGGAKYSCDFQQITSYISKIVQDRHTVYVKWE